MVETWIAHSSVGEDAHLFQQLPRYAPQLGWPAILEVLRQPDCERHYGDLAWCLKTLIVRHGVAFIDHIEQEAARSQRFRACLAEVFADPGARIPEGLWERLTRAAGAAVGPVPPHIDSLYQDNPGLAEALEWDGRPLDPDALPQLNQADLEHLARAWIKYNDTYWAWEEVRRIIEEEGPERAWALVADLVRRAPRGVLGHIGAGPLEDALGRYGELVLEPCEALAAADSSFRYCLSHVWKGEMSDYVWARVVAARGDEPQRG